MFADLVKRGCQPDMLVETFDPAPKRRGTQWEHACKWFLKNDLVLTCPVSSDH